MDRERAFERWDAEGFFFTEAARGGPVTWRVGADKLDGDALGPVRHVHDDAAEYFYMFSGALRMECGGEEFVLEEGELCLIPPDAPHNVLGLAREEDARLYCLIGPNFVTNKWRIDDFKPGSEALRQAIGRPFDGGAPPAGGTLSAEGLTLTAGAPALHVDPAGRECVYLVVSGALDVALANGLHGTLESGSCLHVREGVAHELSTTSACEVLRMDCAFSLWADVALPDAE